MLAAVCGVESLRDTRGDIQNAFNFLFWALCLLVVPQLIALRHLPAMPQKNTAQQFLITEFTYEY